MKNKHKHNPKRKEPNLGRGKPNRDIKPTLLIVCEGRNTEPSYFRQFRMTTAQIKVIGEGYNTLSLVQRTRTLAARQGYDQVWCVFDADPNGANPQQKANFNQAIQLAEKLRFKVAYSNQAFEYWLILHLSDHQGGCMDRKLYGPRINELLNGTGLTYDYQGSKVVSEPLFAYLNGLDPKTMKPRVDLAIERAVRNQDKVLVCNPAEGESCTKVFELVREIRKYK